jgi:GTPase
MKFFDEAKIRVHAGNGGSGCLSFRREKYIPFGGPNGGDGGDGGTVYLVGDRNINTLVDFCHKRVFKAPNGQPGQGSDRRGKGGHDLLVLVPLGTLIYDRDTEELIGEVIDHDQKIKVAQGGYHGLGNARFKTSTNRAPRQISPGSPGETRELYLELKLLADVGLLGLPNAGKSTFIRSISSAKPKVADYPFTTMHPNLGVVRVDAARSFVVADIPGIIEGAAEGIGLGIQFLKHISRTGLLLHVVDVAPCDGSDPVEAVKVIQGELVKYGHEVQNKTRWLVLNKVDLLSDDEKQERCQAIISALHWEGAVYEISALRKVNLPPLLYDIMDFIEGKGEEKE